MKASIIILSFLLARCITGNAQIQELEQLKLDLEKLVQFKLMLSQAKQGYQTLQNGYNAVRDAAKGNYNLHKNYLDELLQVSVQVRNAPALKRFMDNGVLVQKEYRQWYNRLQPLGLFKAQELMAIEQSYQQITSRQSEDLEQLQMILGSSKLRMSDGERIAAIEVLAGKSDEELAALRKLIQEQSEVAAGRAQSKKDVEAIRRLYGVH
jgi:hypothetical protein